jgi:putative NIF3 family GTP cyclohydrolase 1 type 2
MQACELMTKLNSFRDDLPEGTRDRVIYGDPDREIKGVAVCWMAYRETILQAAEAGANIIVTHEPTFYHDRDLEAEEVRDLAASKDKMALLDEKEITVLRCHDAWDYYPEIGIIELWFKQLGLEERLEGLNRFKVEIQTAEAFARHVAAAASEVGQTMVRLYGDPEREVSTVCAWYGWKGPYALTAEAADADLAITYDDDPAVQAWTGAELCHDTGFPLVVINHGTLEERGMVSLADYLQELYPDIPVVHIPQGCNYREILA